MLRRWKYPKDYLDIFWGALGINKNMTCFFCVPTNALLLNNMKHWTFKRKFCDSVFTPKKGEKVGNVKTSAQLVLFFSVYGRPPSLVWFGHHTNHSQPKSLLFLFSARKIIYYTNNIWGIHYLHVSEFTISVSLNNQALDFV